MFRHPALNFDELLFVKRHTPAYAHQCSHHVGEAQQPGADLCVLSVAPTSPTQSVGRRHDAGWKPALQVNVRSVLNGQLPPGGIGRQDLSFDAKRIVFPYAAPRAKLTAYGIGVHGARGGACVMYDIYEIGVDGKGLKRLTNVPDAEDTEPCYLPNGRIAFTSSRDNRFVECGDWALVFSLYSMAADGSDVRRMTEAKEGEWYPSALDDGRVIYMRWEYVMKAYNSIQQLWTVNPDGTKARLAYGDHYAFGRGPISFIEPRQIPGTSKVIATGAAHHNAGVGPICIVDLSLNRAGSGGFLNVTPEVGYPEAGSSNTHSPTGWYSSPYPLTENLFLVSYSFDVDHNSRNGYALYLMDVHGNKELIYRDKEMSCYSPIPLRPRKRPLVIPDAIAKDPNAPGTMLVTDVYQGLPGVKRGTVKYLRVLETLPKKVHSWPQRCDLGVGSGWDPRIVLGVVPVEVDGSAYFRVPPDRAIFFEALDENFLEVRRMRSYVTVRPGEASSCVGCHEGYNQAPPNRGLIALTKPPRDIAPPAWGQIGMDFRKVVQPVLERNCVRCHDGSTNAGKSFDLRGATMVTAPAPKDGDEGPQHKVTDSFLSLLKYVSYVPVGGYGGNYENLPLPVYATGSHQSKLMQLLKDGHKDVKLNRDDWHALAAWIDCNAPFYGGWDGIEYDDTLPATAIRKVAVTPAQKQATAQRKVELNQRAPNGYCLACYLDCGPEEQSRDGDGAEIQQISGFPWLFYEGSAPAPPRCAAITFHPEKVIFEVSRLDPRKTYRLGLTWWDWDSGGRVQSVRVASCDGKLSAVLLDKMALPNWTHDKQKPAEHILTIPPALVACGKIRIIIQKEGGANAVVSEVWVWEGGIAQR
jgi:hypothetical protein